MRTTPIANIDEQHAALAIATVLMFPGSGRGLDIMPTHNNFNFYPPKLNCAPVTTMSAILYDSSVPAQKIFPREIIVQLVGDSRTLRVFRQTCREYSALTAWLGGPRWEVTTSCTYDTAPWRSWHDNRRPTNECHMNIELPQITSVTIHSGGAPVSTWYPVYADTLAGIYSACLAREYLLIGANPVMPYRTYQHWFPLEDFYTPVEVKITYEAYERTCAVTINPADFSHDYIDSLFTFAGHEDEYDRPAGSVFDCVLITLHAPASAIYEYFAGHPLRV